MRDAIIVGAGISGLACALRLHSAGRDVLVVEERDEPGGNIRTFVDGRFRMERGPHTFMGSADDVFALAGLAGATQALVPARAASAVRYIARGGKLHEVFTSPMSFLRSDLLSWRGKLDLVTEPLRTARGDPSDSAARFFERRFGPEAAKVLAGSFVSGVYAGDPEALSAPAAFPLFWRFEQQSGGMVRGAIAQARERRKARKALGVAAPPVRKGLWSLRGGLGALTAACAAVLGERLRTSAHVESVHPDPEAGGWVVEAGGERETARAVVLAAPPRAAAAILGSLDEELGRLAGGVTMAPVAVVHLGFERRSDRVPDAFGFLVPRGEGVRTLGVLFPSRMFEDRAEGGGDLFTGFVGGALDREALALDDRALGDIVLGDLKRLTGLGQAPDLLKVLRYEHAIPQLGHGHLERMAELRRMLGNHAGLCMAGNWLTGVGMKDAVKSGFEAADLVSGSLLI